jgi:hypothetical protein
MFHTHVASVLFEYCVCLQWFSSVFTSVSDACFKCFIYLQTYIQGLHLDVLKVDQGVAHGIRVDLGFRDTIIKA